MLENKDTNKYLDRLTILPKVVENYIPNQLLRHVDKTKIWLQSDLLYLKSILENSNNQLRMYGTANDLLANVLLYIHFPLRRKMFPIEIGSCRYTIPDRYHNLKGELFYCKQDYLFHLQNSVYTEVFRDTLSPKVIEYMKKHEERLGGCYEFIKYDEEIFSKIRGLFQYSAILRAYTPEQLQTLTVTPYVKCFVAPQEEKDFIGIFENLISEYPGIFLPNSETKDKNVTVAVRIFESGTQKYVMESELYNAINTKHPELEPLECHEKDGFMKTIDMKEVYENFCYQITDISFIRWPIVVTKHAAAPVVTPTGDHCILAADALIEILNRTVFALNIFQKINRNAWRTFPKFMKFLEKYFPPDIKYRYFMDLRLFKKLEAEHDEFWKAFENKPAKTVRDVGPNGFTAEDLKKELKYLGITDIFPELLREVRHCYTVTFPSRKASDLKTCDMFDAIRLCLFTVLFTRFESIQEFMHRQKYCIHNRTAPCGYCVKAFEGVQLQIEAEKREEAKRTISGAERSTDDRKCNEMSCAEAKPKPIPGQDSTAPEDKVDLNQIAPAASVNAPSASSPLASSTDPAPIPVVDRTYRTISTTPILPTHPIAEIKSEQASIPEPEPPVSEVKDHTGGCEMDPLPESAIRSEPILPAVVSPLASDQLPVPGIQSSDIRSEPILPSMDPPPPSDLSCQKCNESREEVIETYRKVMNLEKSLKEKDAELEKLRDLEIKAKKSDEMETKLKELEKESEELKKKHLKILEENHKMMKDHGSTKELKHRLKEKELTLEASENSKDSMETEIQDLRKVSYSWVSKVAEKDKKIKELEEKLRKAKEDNENLKSSKDLLSKAVNDMQQVYGMHTNMLSESDAKMEELASIHTESMEKKDEEIKQLKRDHSKLMEKKTGEVEQLKQAHSKLMAEKTKEWTVEKKNHSKTIDELKKTHSEAMKLKVSKFKEVLKAKIGEKDVEVLQTKRINKELSESIRILKLKMSNLEEKSDADHLEMAMKQSNLEEEIAKLQESKTQQAAEQDKAKETISTIRGLLDTISPAPMSPEVQQALLSLQKRRDALRENSPLKLAKEMVERLISLSTRPEIHQMARYEYEQYEGKVCVYVQELEVSINKLNDKSSMTTPIPSQFPSFSDRFIDEYWMEIQKSRTEQRVDNECLICFDEMTPEQKTLECTQCKKVFHLKCASQWLKVARTCSHCRQNQLDPNEFPALQ